MESTYSSVLTANSPRYSPTGCGASDYHYAAIQVNVVRTGCYSLDSSSSVNTFGYLYKNDFNPLNVSENLFAQNDGSMNNMQFKFITHLVASTTYVLVVTTSSPNLTAAFTVLVSGPNTVRLNRISEYL
jgi:hypothetical protein